MFCEKCGKQLNDGARFCESCGTPVNLPKPNQTNGNMINTGNCANTSKPQKKKDNNVKTVIVLVIIGFFGLFFILTMSAISKDLTASNTSDNMSDTDTSVVNQEEAKKQENSFVDIANITQEQEDAVTTILSQCGVGTVSKITLEQEQSNENISVYTLTSPQSKKGTITLYLNQGIVGGLTFNGEALYKDGAVVTTIDNILNRPDLEVLSKDYAAEGYMRYVTGEIRNNTNKNYSYVQVEIGLYLDDTLVGSTLDNVNNLGPGEVWKFKAIILEDSANKFKITDITGF